MVAKRLIDAALRLDPASALAALLSAAATVAVANELPLEGVIGALRDCYGCRVAQVAERREKAS